MRPFLISLVLFAGCQADSPAPLAPIPGTVHHFVIDDFTFPETDAQATAFGGDLDGNQTIDNQLGHVTALLAPEHDLNANVVDIIRAGVIVSPVDLQFDDQQPTSVAGVRIFGYPGAPATVIRGQLTNGVFASGRTANTDAPGKAIMRLPVLADADPINVDLDGVELDLVPDTTGGFVATVRGGIQSGQLIAATTPKVLQMANSNPQDHGSIALLCTGLVASRESVLSHCDIGGYFSPDIRRSDVDSVSAGFQLHITPCTGETCSLPPPMDRCHDRIADGDETAVDCGGATCALRCAGGLLCQSGSDCASGVCAGGACAPPTCSDGVRDGFETGVDSGGPCN